MNKSISFGYHQFALGVFIKLNVKLRDKDSELLAKKYVGLAVLNNGKHGHRLEGVITHKEISVFHTDLEMMKLDYKIETMIEKKEQMFNACLPKVDISQVNFDDI